MTGFMSMATIGTTTKSITVTCPNGETDCCEHDTYKCSTTRKDFGCIEGYQCNEGICEPA